MHWRSIWIRPNHPGMLPEWSRESTSSIISGLPTCAYFIGCLVGGLVLGSLADSYLGRKKLLVISCVVMSLGGGLSAFSTTMLAYSCLRFVSGIGRGSIMTCVLCLSTEIVGKRWRGHVSLIAFSSFTLGFLLLVATAYALQDSSWRIVYVATTIPAFPYAMVVYFLVVDSPRWLFLHGNHEEAILVLVRLLQADLYSTKSLTSMFYRVRIVQETTDIANMYSAITHLVSKRWATQRLILVMMMGFGVALVYIGMPLGVGELGLNIYLSVASNTLIEIPASVITFFLVNHLCRRSTILLLTTLSAIFSITCGIAHDKMEGWGIIGLELMSYFTACTAFDFFLMYVVELFPTCIRNTAVSLVRQGIAIGSVFSPIVVALGKDSSLLEYGILGLAIGLSGLLVVFLPETRGKAMCDTMEEQEHMEIDSNDNGTRDLL
ncbi:hypothetical protein Drorol1_Dr00002747 [Drosera rotundifolia]